MCRGSPQTLQQGEAFAALWVFSCFSHCCGKILHKSNPRKSGFVLAHGLRVQSVIAGEEHEVPGDTVAAVGEQTEVDNGTQLLSSFSLGLTPWDGATHIRVGLSTLVKLCWETLTDTQNCLRIVILYLVGLTGKSNRHRKHEVNTKKQDHVTHFPAQRIHL